MITAAATISDANIVATGATSDESGWHQLASLPDPIGFGGMFAGKIGELLVAGGGSQFRDKPAWLGGVKNFSDRIFILKQADAQWSEHRTRLPEASGHFASAYYNDAIYVAGGISDRGCLAACYALRTEGDDFVIERLRDLPHPLVYAAAVIANGVLYVAGGQHALVASKPSKELWSLELNKPDVNWLRLADLPEAGVIVPSMASDGKYIYIFSGMMIDEDGTAAPSNRAYRYDTVANRGWEGLPDMPEARVGAATPCPQIGSKGLLVIGGFHETYMGDPREYPGFSAQTLIYKYESRVWEKGPVFPCSPVGNRDCTNDSGPVPIVAAPCVRWNERVVVVGGETRPSTRTSVVMAYNL